MKKDSSFGVKQITITAVLLAICIISQVFKNLSIFVTGPIVNLCLALAVVMAGLPCAIILSIITPITAYFIAASPVMNAVPLIIPFIAAGNIVFVLAIHFLLKKEMAKPAKRGYSLICYVKAVLCALIKGAFMGLTISLWLLPTFIPAESPLRGKMPVFQTTFSIFQFITALVGFIYFFIIMVAVNHSKKNNEA
ncbi:ECF transporter S component [Butyrivibrio proteoclasticus]|uniref:ECF transporter S component n=1 Tax=Butyrivibrio proteoclasticus TaxID=43305 RepID=UPI00047C14B0|nr:ECF transporter S component [Butyrivibrio proteoclasticus]